MKINQSDKSYLDRVFSGTTVDVQQVKTAFLSNKPGYLRNALTTGQSGNLLINMNLLTELEMSLRKYVAGETETLATLLNKAEILSESKPGLASVLTKLAFVSVNRLVLNQELFELLPRYQEAEKYCDRYLIAASCN